MGRADQRTCPGNNDKIPFFFRFVVVVLLSQLLIIMFPQAFPGHRNTVSYLCFRHGSTELYSGSFDRSVKAWNVEDKAFVQDSFGHQDDVLAIDALRKERAISVGRDRTMQLHKVKNSIFFINILVSGVLYLKVLFI